MPGTSYRNRKATRFLGLIFVLAFFSGTLALIRHASSHEASGHTTTGVNLKENRARVNEAYGKLPLSFEPNVGQLESKINFISRGDGYSLSLSANEAALSLRQRERRGKEPGNSESSKANHPRSSNTATLRWKLIGASPASQAEGLDELSGKVNYFTGSDANKWHTDIPTFARVRYSKIYPGVDLIYYGHNRQLEYDFIVSPGADPKTIKMAFEGTQKLSINEQGDLILSTPLGEIRQERPVLYQEVNGARQEVAGHYVLRGRREVGFEVARYDANRPLIIDPVISFSTFLGGANDDFAYGIAVDTAGNSYVTGYTVSDNFPTANPFQATRKGAADVFVTKLDPSGTRLIYSTYLGGIYSESGTGIVVDNAGNAYITGSTPSPDFPVTPGAYQPVKSSGNVPSQRDAFITKLNQSGNALVFSTYLGGGKFEETSNAIKIDTKGNVYIAGTIEKAAYDAEGTEFPATPDAVQPTYGGQSDAFVAKINSKGTALIYATFLGRSDKDYGYGLAVDSAGNAYVTGETYSADFPTTPGAYRPTKTDLPSDAFVTKLNETGTALVYSTFIGGPNNSDRANSIAVDTAGNAYITGITASNYPVTPGAFQADSAYPGSDVFVTKFNAAGSALVYSSRFGGTDHSSGNAIAIDSDGNAYVTGYTRAFDFPIVNAFQPQKKNGADAFITEVNASGSNLVFSSFLGGQGSDDTGTGIALDPAANIYVTGFTHSRDFPITAGAFQTLLNRSEFGDAHDAFVTKLTPGDSPAPPADSVISGHISTDGGAPMSGVTLTLIGYQTVTTTTDSNGNYSFRNLQNGVDYTIGASKTNYDFNPSWHYFKNLTGTKTADFTGALKTYVINGHITDDLSRDLGGVTLTLTGSQSGTTTTSSTGDYSFYVTAEGNYTVTPSKTAYRFSPQSRQFNNLSSDQWQVNFNATLVPGGLPLSR